MALVTYPLNDIDYSAEDAELFHCTRNSGIYANDDFAASVTGSDTKVTVGAGIAWIKNSRFSGKVTALKAPESVALGLSDSVYPRIDVIAIRFDANANATTIVAKQGTAASSPAIPAISRTESVYELYLFAVRREAGSSVVSASDITDLRLDNEYCGIMADSVTKVDTSAISAQVYTLIKKLSKEIEMVKDGSAYLWKSGGYMQGPLVLFGKLILTEGVHYGPEEPIKGEEGQIYFVEIAE